MTIPPSTRPVYLKGPKGKGEAELWVRVGNSTRRLEVADAVQYVATRWPEFVRVSPLTRIRLFLTMSRHRDTPTRLPRVVERVLVERAKHGGGVAEGSRGTVKLAPGVWACRWHCAAARGLVAQWCDTT